MDVKSEVRFGLTSLLKSSKYIKKKPKMIVTAIKLGILNRIYKANVIG
jgi:hypothetical protein